MSPKGSKTTLALPTKLAFSVGHVLNDLVASMMLSYMIVYLNKVIEIDSGLAGIIFLAGQICDAVVTPLIGYKSDRSGFLKFGKRKSWHLLGTILVSVTFPFLFIDNIVSSSTVNWAKIIYFMLFLIGFHIGYASIQISHFALIPELTSDCIERVGLTSYRVSLTVISNMTLYGIAWALFDFMNTIDESEDLGPGDSAKFRTLALIVIGIGILSSVIFHVGVKETKQNANEMTNATDDKTDDIKMKWNHWFKETQFYQVAVMYMCSRLICNVSQVYLAFYLIETIELDKTSIATMPFIVYISGLLTSLLMRYVNKKAGRKVTYLIGILFTLGGCITFYVLKDGSNLVYLSVIVNGIGSSTVLVTSLSMIADLIGRNTESGAFVYGVMGVKEKLATGVAIALIQQLNPSCCGEYFRYILTFVPGGVCLVASVVLATMIPVKLGFRRNQRTVLTTIHVPALSMINTDPEKNIVKTASNEITMDTKFCPELCSDWL